MKDDSEIAAAQETHALIDLILTRYHAVHRAELATLLPLAEKVETVHGDDPQAPQGLTQALMTLRREKEDHMSKEEMVLFPAMRSGERQSLEFPITLMRADHHDQEMKIDSIREMTSNLTPPEYACGSWRALYAGTAKLLDDLTEHARIENDVLFPRFEQD
jgi:regulator of cell morphogenesis and NO signaling